MLAAAPAPQDYNDIFGFFIWPLPGGTPKNVALLPNSTQLVSITTINPVNNTYYISNPFGTGPYNTEFNGLTKLLNTTDYSVTAGTKYRVVLAIADGFDDQYDSIVWIKYGSIRFKFTDCVGSWMAATPTQCSGQCGGGSGWLTEVFNVTSPATNGGTDCTTTHGTTRNNTTTCVNSTPCPPVNCVGSWTANGNCTGRSPANIRML